MYTLPYWYEIMNWIIFYRNPLVCQPVQDWCLSMTSSTWCISGNVQGTTQSPTDWASLSCHITDFSGKLIRHKCIIIKIHRNERQKEKLPLFSNSRAALDGECDKPHIWQYTSQHIFVYCRTLCFNLMDSVIPALGRFEQISSSGEITVLKWHLLVKGHLSVKGNCLF